MKRPESSLQGSLMLRGHLSESTSNAHPEKVLPATRKFIAAITKSSQQHTSGSLTHGAQILCHQNTQMEHTSESCDSPVKRGRGGKAVQAGMKRAQQSRADATAAAAVFEMSSISGLQMCVHGKKRAQCLNRSTFVSAARFTMCITTCILGSYSTLH